MNYQGSNYSIVKVSGISMKPFFQSEEILLVKKDINVNNLKKGQCVLVDGNIHRYLHNNQVKGDRLLYFDPTTSQPSAFVIGKILHRKNKKFLSDHNDYVLRNIAKTISTLSNLNRESNPFRIIILLLIIFLSYSHRTIELFTAREFKT